MRYDDDLHNETTGPVVSELCRATPCSDPRSRPFGSFIPYCVVQTRPMAAILPLHLPDHLPTLLISTVGFAAIHHLGAPEFARFLLGKKGWDALGSRERVGWCVFVSFPHLYSFVVVIVC